MFVCMVSMLLVFSPANAWVQQGCGRGAQLKVELLHGWGPNLATAAAGFMSKLRHHLLNTKHNYKSTRAPFNV